MAHENEIIYGVQLLDDLHNYFPDLLYNNSRFRSVQDILSYITLTTRNRFDLYSLGRSRYFPPASRRNVRRRIEVDTDSKDEDEMNNENNIQSRIPLSTQTSTETNTQTNQNQNSETVNNGVSAPGSSPVRVSASVHTIPLTSYPFESMLFEVPITTTARRRNGVTASTGLDDMTTSMNLINSLTTLFTGGGVGLPSNFLNPIDVRPTPQQIQNATRVFNMVIHTEDDVCAICQDDMDIGNDIREINICHHKFHKSCIDTWFQRNVHCPVCRHDIRDMDE